MTYWRIIAGIVFALVCADAAHSAPSIEDYGRYPDMEMPQISPSGKLIAYVGLAGDQRKLAVETTAGGIIRVIDLGTVKARSIHWAGDEHVIIDISRTEAVGTLRFTYEIPQSLVVNVMNGKYLWVFEHTGRRNVAQGVFGYFGSAAINGHWYGSFAGVPVKSASPLGPGYITTGIPDLWRVDLDTGAESRIAVADGDNATDWAVDADGRVVAHSSYEEAGANWKLYGNSRDGGGALLARNDNDPYAESGLDGLGRTPNTVVYHTIDEAQHRHVFEADLDNPGHETELLSGREVLQMYYDAQTMLLMGAELSGSTNETRLFDPSRQQALNNIQAALKGRFTRLESYNGDFTKIIVATNGTTDSGTHWLIDTKAGRADILGQAYPTVTEADVAPFKMFSYKAGDGLSLEGVLTLPPGRPSKNLPVVVLPHGGPAARDSLGFDWWSQAFAHLGYAVFQPNFRGSTGYGDEFLVAGYGEWGRKMQTDVSDGLAALSSAGIVDPKRACIMGGSYGGYVALAGVTLQHGLYRCSVSVAGVSDLSGMLKYETERSGRQSEVVRYWRNYWGKSKPGESLGSLSPLNLASTADAPILLIHGHDDTVVPISQSTDMRNALKSAGKAVEFVELQSEDHWLSTQSTRIEMLKAASAFILKNNPPQ